MSVKKGGATIAGLQDISSKADTDFSNTNMIDYVVETQFPTSANNYTWYRKYKSGWVEQGGQPPAGTSNVTITLPVEMADTNYTITGMAKGGAKVVSCNTWSTTSITLQYNAISGSGVAHLCWEVKGMAA